MKEGANDLRAAAQAANRPTDGSLQHGEVRRAGPAQGMLFQPSPEPFIGIEFRSIGRQPMYPEAVPVGTQRLPCTPRAVRVAAIPEQEDGSGDPAQQVFDEADHFVAGDGARYQVQIGVRVRRHRGDSRKLRPVEAVAQNRCLSSGGPGAASAGQQRKTAFVHENQRSVQVLGFFFKRGHVC